MSTYPSLSPALQQNKIPAAGRRGANGFARLELWKNAAGYAATLLVALIAMTGTLRLWRADIRVPFHYRGDNIFNLMFVQNVMESGWVTDGPRLGAPGVQDMRDFPVPDVLHLTVMKLMGYVFHDAGIVLNLYFLICFPLTALASYFVLRRFRLGRVAALTASVLYACLPYHYMRNYGHVFLAGYYMLPLLIWLAVRFYLGRYPLIQTDGADGKPRWRFWSVDAAGAALICILTGLAGAYYAFFSCFFLLAAAMKAAFRERRWTPLIVSSLFVALISTVLFAALIPNTLNTLRNGKNPEAAPHIPAQADQYGLTITELLLPIDGHRLSFFQNLRDRFLSPPRVVTGESWAEPLGVTASIGLLYLLGRFFWRPRGKTERTADALAYLAVVALFLGTVGGLGSLFNFHVTPMIRCYSRLSVSIGFFALAGLFLTLHRWAGLCDRNLWARLAVNAGWLAVLVLGLLDQTSPKHIPPYAEEKRQYQSDVDFAHRMEAALPSGAMVYQLPLIFFPEGGGGPAMTDYELSRPYYYTRALRFSYGAMRRREISNMLAELGKKPLAESMEKLAFAGFRGVYLDRGGYADAGAAVEADLGRLLGAAPAVSLTGRQVFFDMTSYVNALRTHFTEAEWDAKAETASHPLEVEWFGASDEEKGLDNSTFHWCGANMELKVRNYLNHPRRVVMKMSCVGWQDRPVRLALDGDLCRREVALTTIPQAVELELVVPPGRHSISFHCDGQRYDSPGDRRELVFRVVNLDYHIEGE